VPPKQSAEVLQRLPASPLTTLTEWPGLGHLAHEERPALAAEHVIGVARRAGVPAR
jgi:magnesium chelatase accessory protein